MLSWIIFAVIVFAAAILMANLFLHFLYGKPPGELNYFDVFLVLYGMMMAASMEGVYSFSIPVLALVRTFFFVQRTKRKLRMEESLEQFDTSRAE